MNQARFNLVKVVLSNDCGEVVNPLLVDRQIIGGAVQAIGQALYEQLEYGEDGTLLTASLSDYLIPSALDVPEIISDRTITPAPNPLKAYGIMKGWKRRYCKGLASREKPTITKRFIKVRKDLYRFRDCRITILITPSKEGLDVSKALFWKRVPKDAEMGELILGERDI